MNTNRNRRGSVLLMAIGMLTVLAILASTFVIVSNLESEETESLVIRSQTAPLATGMFSKAIAAITADRYPDDTKAYGKAPSGASGFAYFIDCSRKYAVDGGYEYTDSWLSDTYLPGEGISDQGSLTNLGGQDHADKCELGNGKGFNDGGTYENGLAEEGGNVYVDTDGDGIPDALLVDTEEIVPAGADPNEHYYMGVRIVDTASRICVNTAAGWNATEGAHDRPISGPSMINLRNFLGGSSAVYDLFHVGDQLVTGIYGRVGEASPIAGSSSVSGLAPGSSRGYAKYCGTQLLGPARPTSGQGGYVPFSVGDEPFFLNASNYLQNVDQFGGRIGQLIGSQNNNGTYAPVPDSVRRQLTTFSSVAQMLRRQGSSNGPQDVMVLDKVDSEAKCREVYQHMQGVLHELGVGNTTRDKMAAHFAANLWAYCAHGDTGAPWKLDAGGYTVYGLRQDMVITQVFARHIANWDFDANDPSKDSSAYGYAIELANPTTEQTMTLSNYELEIKPDNGTPKAFSLSGWPPVLNKALANATSPNKHVVYSFTKGPDNTLNETEFFGFSGRPNVQKTDDMKLCLGAGSVTITLYRKVAGERVPIDQVKVGEGASNELEYKTDVTEDQIKGSHAGQGTAPVAGNACAHIRRDDRLKEGNFRRARYNMAVYKKDALGWTYGGGAKGGPGTKAFTAADDKKLGAANGITDWNELDKCIHGSGKAEHSPGIYRPRDTKYTNTPSEMESMPVATPDYDYYLRGLGELVNIYCTGPAVQGADAIPFTAGILKDGESKVFEDQPDRGRMPSVRVATDGGSNNVGAYPDIPPAYLLHEFFTRTPGHQARAGEKKRLYGMLNINTAAIPKTPSSACAIWHLPWPKDDTQGSKATNTGNRVGAGETSFAYNLVEALQQVAKYRDETNRAWADKNNLLGNLRSATSYRGFLTPGEVGIPLAAHLEDKLGANIDKTDADYIRARNSLFGYISDCITTRSDVYACYVTIQVGKKAKESRRWRYVALIDRSNVMTNTDSAVEVMSAQLK